ncbi:MAG: uroporphyrinogen-III synthase [Thalassobaculaceae bacterium]|nr:uroporphyrinogen-III synthase [Thalassobaculaceae bacterium]
MRRVIVTRPAEASAELQGDLAARGIAALSAPMLAVEVVTPPDGIPDRVQALLVTSRNGAEGAARLTGRRDLPMLAVGDATAEAASRAGFVDVTTASGDASALIDLVVRCCDPGAGPLLWVSGAAVSTDLAASLAPRGFTVERRVAYRTVAADRMPPEAAAALRERSVEGVLFFSPRSAEAFARLLSGSDLRAACASMAAYCMSDAIAEAASKLAWQAIHVAESPTKAALVEALVRYGAGREAKED